MIREKRCAVLQLCMGLSVVSGLGKRIPSSFNNEKEENTVDSTLRGQGQHDPVCIIIIAVLSIILTSLAIYKIYKLCAQLFRPSIPLTRPDGYTCSCSTTAYDPHLLLSAVTDAGANSTDSNIHQQMKDQQQAVLKLTLLNLNITECPCSYLHQNKSKEINTSIKCDTRLPDNCKKDNDMKARGEEPELDENIKPDLCIQMEKENNGEKELENNNNKD